MTMLKVITKNSFLLLFLIIFSCKKREDNMLCKNVFTKLVQAIATNKNKIQPSDYKVTEYDSNTSLIFFNKGSYCMKYVNNKFVCLYILSDDLLPTYCLRNDMNDMKLYKIIYNQNSVEVMESSKKINKTLLNLGFCDFLSQYEKAIKDAEFDKKVLTLPELFLKNPLWKEINL